jgi:hypothetical protein
MNRNEENLVSALKVLAASETAGPPAALEAQLVKAMRRRRRVISWPLALEVLAAAAVLMIALYSRSAPAAADGFIAVPYSTPIGPYERADLVRVNVPVSALAQWGLSISALNPNQRVEAEVVLGEDGLARAFRLTSN